MRRVLSVASECVPLAKTGGLADVAGALPAALAGQGWEMRVLVPAYRGLAGRFARLEPLWSAKDLFGGPARVLAGRLEGIPFLLLDAPHLFDRAGGPYLGPDGEDHPDNPERFAALSWAAAEIARDGLADGWRPDILHAHDWQGALAPAYLHFAGIAVPSVLTIHNIAFQGLAPPGRLAALRLPEAGHAAGGVLEYYGRISTLKAGIALASAVTTVSPRYAAELARPEYGMGLEGVIAARPGAALGILNGIDTAAWNPGADRMIAVPYGVRSLGRKSANRTALLAEFGLAPVEGPLAVVVSRLTAQKGLDLLPEALPGFIAAGGGVAVLGAGEGGIEAALNAAARRFPGRVAVKIGYDEALSHRMFAGGDAVLVPSRFEPCGLTQLYALRYGAVPVVAATGGLADTVIDANPAALAGGVATGIILPPPLDGLALRQGLARLVALHADRRAFQAMQRAGMRQDFGWARSSAAYARLYEGLLP